MKEVIIIGGGAAGLMCGVTLAENGIKTTIVEKNEKLGKKIYITGKGRCNMTNLCERQEFFKSVTSNPKFLYSSVNAFDAAQTVDFFESHGLRTKTERGNRVFPESEHASDVTKTLEKAFKRAGGQVVLNTVVTDIVSENGCFSGVKLNDGTSLRADACVIATGGLSYESTGSTGDGYVFAARLGHKVTDTFPSLVGLKTIETFVNELEGLSLKNVGLSAWVNGKKKYDEHGEMLFTRNGISGPLVLTVSSLLAKNIAGNDKVTVKIDMKPALDEEALDRRVLKDFAESVNKDIKNVLGGLLPSSLIPVILTLSGIGAERKVNGINAKERERLVRLIKGIPLEIKCSGGFNEAVITQGGVSVKEINPKTMESKLCSGIYFAGEVMDVDALTGGYNLQIAWSTAHAAAMSIIERSENDAENEKALNEYKKQENRMNKVISIAIDGPSGAGKSTIAKKVSEKAGAVYVDTGAMYRAMALYFLRNGVSAEDEATISSLCDKIDIELKIIDGVLHVFLNGEDVSGLIRNDEVGAMASKTSVYADVRTKLVDLQRKMAEKQSVVMDGRDIGSVVLPNAKVKIYLTASVEERARRRYLEYEAAGQNPDMDTIRKEIEERDYRDMHRDISPLVCAEDAVVVDSSDMSIDEVCERIYSIINERCAD